MLESSILQQVTEIFRNLEADYTFRISQSPLREESSQLIEFLNDFASTSPHLKVENHEADGDTLMVAPNIRMFGLCSRMSCMMILANGRTVNGSKRLSQAIKTVSQP